MKAKCTKSVWMEGDDDQGPPAFTKDWEYESTNPEIWPMGGKVCLIDNEKRENFMTWKWFHKHFQSVLPNTETK